MNKLYAYDTPRTDDPHTVKLVISDADMSAFDRLPRGSGRKTADVVDRYTGKRYRARRASCGLRCFCAAQVELIGSGDVGRLQ